MKQVPLFDLKLEYNYMKEDIDGAIKNCLEHQQWILGPEVKELEDKIAEYIGVKHCIGVSSGTEALVLSLRTLALTLKGQEYFDKEDEIITTPFTFIATGDAILRAGATPVFVDIDPETYNIDPTKIREYLDSTETCRVVGVIPVHLYGLACNMDEIMAVAKEHDLFVLEDVAQAFGGMWRDKKLGSIGTAATFSFYPSKNLGGFGDAGMVATNDGRIAELVRMLLRHGGKDKYNVSRLGYNARLDTLQAAILLAKFKYVDEFNNRRRHLAEIYSKELAAVDDLTLPPNPENAHPSPNTSTLSHTYHVYHQYTLRILDGKRDGVQKHLKENLVSTMVYYPVPLHKMKVFEGRKKTAGTLENSELAASEVISLPIEPLQDQADTAHVAALIREFCKK